MDHEVLSTSYQQGMASTLLHFTASTTRGSSSRGVVTAAAPDTSETLKIDDTAVTRLKELAAEKPGAPPSFLRVEVEGGGCSGFQYKFRLDDTLQDEDITFDKDGVRIVCDTVSFEFLKGAKLTYEDSLIRSAFTVSSNPNTESTCGCGTSFVAKMK